MRDQPSGEGMRSNQGRMRNDPQTDRPAQLRQAVERGALLQLLLLLAPLWQANQDATAGAATSSCCCRAVAGVAASAGSRRARLAAAAAARCCTAATILASRSVRSRYASRLAAVRYSTSSSSRTPSASLGPSIRCQPRCCSVAIMRRATCRRSAPSAGDCQALRCCRCGVLCGASGLSLSSPASTCAAAEQLECGSHADSTDGRPPGCWAGATAEPAACMLLMNCAAANMAVNRGCW